MKNWWESRTIWSAVMVIVALIVRQALKVEMTEEDTAAAVDYITAIVAAIGALGSIWGRIKASKPIR